MENPEAEIPAVIRLLTQSVPSVQKQTIERHYTPSASITHPFCRTGSFYGSRWLVVQIYRFYKIMSPGIEIDIKSAKFDPETLLLYVSIHQTFRIWVFPFYSAPVSLVSVLQLSEGEEGQFPQPSRRPSLHLSPSQSPHPRPRSDRHIQFEAIPPSPLSHQRSSEDLDANAEPDDGLPSPRGPEHPPSPPPIPSLTLQQRRQQQQQQQQQQRGHPSRRLYYISSQEDLYQTNEFIKFVVPFGIGAGLVILWQICATVGCLLGVVVFWPVLWAEQAGYMPWPGQGPRNVRKVEQAVGREKMKS